MSDSDTDTQLCFSGAVDERFIAANPEVRTRLVDTYYAIVDNLELCMKHKSDDDGEATRAYFDKVIKGLREDAVGLREERDVYATEMVQRHTKHLENELNNSNERNKHLTEINEFLKKEKDVELVQYKSCTEKGQVGENLIASYLETIPGTKMSMKSDVAMCSDIWCEYEDCNILIECKHMKTVKKRDMDKFHRDVRMNTVDGAILVSISDGVRIPHKHWFDCEILDGRVPCVYITSFESNKHVLFAALQWLKLYKQKCRNTPSAKMKEMLVGVMDEWEKQISSLQKHKRLIKGLMDDVVIMENSMMLTMTNVTAQMENE
jgi:hypothetical protein